MTVPAETQRAEAVLRAAFARLDVGALAAASGVLVGFALFVATAALLLKGAPPGEHIGPHLGLLGDFFVGYSVSWFGSVVGFVYGFVVGAIVGSLCGILWNLAHYLFIAIVALRALSDRIMVD